MEERNSKPDTTAKKPYVAPAITFEYPTEALAANCSGATCPSKQASGLCESVEACLSAPNS